MPALLTYRIIKIDRALLFETWFTVLRKESAKTSACDGVKLNYLKGPTMAEKACK